MCIDRSYFYDFYFKFIESQQMCIYANEALDLIKSVSLLGIDLSIREGTDSVSLIKGV